MARKSASQTIMGCLFATALGVGPASAAIVVNGGFEGGNAGFSSGYGFVPPTPGTSCFPEGIYTLGSNPQACHNLWFSFAPHTGSQMMIVNGSTAPGVNVWQEAGLTVLPNTDYLVSAWLASVYPTNPAQLVFSINGVQIGSPFSASSAPGVWEQFSTVFNSGSNNSVQLDIVNVNTEPGGNDFALDDIGLTPSAIPEPVSLLLLGPAIAGLGLIRRRQRTAHR